MMVQLSKQSTFLIRVLWSLAFLASRCSLMAQSDPSQANADYTVTKRLLSIEDGLASHEVFCGVQDAAGFLWFGTRNGLNRYDGKNSLLFTRQRNRLQDNKVVQLARDDANRLFIEYGSTGFQLTTNGKVDVMDATTHEVKTLTEAFPNLPFKEQDVYWIANDGTGEVSFLTALPFRLWKFSSKKGFRLRYEMKDWDHVVSASDRRTTGPYSSFAEGKALLKLVNQEKQYLLTGDTAISFRQNNVLRSLPIGFTEQNEALITYNTSDDPDHFAVDLLSPKGRLTPVSDLNQYQLNPVKGRYWYQAGTATDGSASFFYNANDALFVWNKQAFIKVLDKAELKGFENLFIYRLFPDALGNLWACTSLGVLQIRLKKNRFKPYFSTGQQSMEPNSQARGIYAEGNGNVFANIWAHTFGQQREKMQAIRHPEINYALVKHHAALYTGGYSLSRYEPGENKIISFPAGLGSEIWAMHSLNDSLLLLGRTNGFSLFNSKTSRFDTLSISDPSMPNARFVYRFFRDKQGAVWAVAENGLYKLILNKTVRNNGQLIITKLQSPFLDALTLMDAYQNADGSFWLATNGEGLYHWNPGNNATRQFNITSGFPSDVLYRIESDAFGNLWISSDYGLIRFNRKDFSVKTYTTIDGITNNEFNRTSSFKGSDGKLFFGGLNGVNAFDPKDFRADITAFQVPLRVIAFNQFAGSKNELINKTTALLRKPQIILQPDDKFFTLDFQLLDFTKDEGHRYGYKLEGLDETWNYISENSVRISGLPYGHYILRIKAQNREGAWNTRELSIPITVLKPVYLQWWFILIVALLFLLAIYLVIQLRLKQLARDKKKLEETVNERTVQLKKSLAEQSALLLEKDVLMKEIHHRVKNNLQVISGLLELQSKTLTDETAKEALREGRNRVRSIALIHQNLYQFENLSSIDLRQFINDLCKQVQSVFQRQKTIAVTVNVPELNLDIDSAVPLGLILNELLSNSFKYAFTEGKSGKIDIVMHTLEEGKYQLAYADNGPGLPVDFDVSKAKTLGLQLINDLARQMGGRVQYETRNGAAFTINFTNREVRKNQD
ncbi:histidine kinase dimerization/phosphoacceptor domain -containing protein [Dyadobacter psychrophilus]|uniref:Two-component sensor histidine kinase, contains HisKA and HATPase domains n=1 Tax=Dyadobacter psychrophilus TaxID=651661 RepID=A0A1T5EUH8_9BACT|nr:histidine kinase dimerization/phosphoacceptor domain -containing protein [Dyadobacter psychrophilus]SKB87518.1 Two-component sensor histidine kinase, contains HisKA and HATPase domains [Dyadobacter psychrophilus]